MKTYKITFIMMLTAAMATAQIDKTRMNRDLEIASTVLNSMMNKNGLMQWEGVNGSPNGKYIEGYGVILNMPNNHLIFGNIPPSPPASNSHSMHFDTNGFDDDERVIVEGSARSRRT